MKKLSDLDVVYSGYTENLTNAADRRRFPFFLNEQKQSFRFSWRPINCDLAYITDASDLSGWCAHKKLHGDKFTLILEFVDMHFHYPPSLSQFFKGSIRFLKGRESRLSLRFTEILKHACRTADMIICASEDQRDILLEFNTNVHITLDRFETPRAPPKSNFHAGTPFKIGWEGQPYTLNGVNYIAEALNAFGDRIELHLITDNSMKSLRPGGTKSIMSQIPDVECPIVLHSWDLKTFQRNICACDAMILPLNKQDFSQWAKPANRMLSLWHLNMPVVASSSRAFKELQENAGLTHLCMHPGDWRNKLEALIGMSSIEREKIANKGRNHASEFYNDIALMRRWSDALKSCGIQTSPHQTLILD